MDPSASKVVEMQGTIALTAGFGKIQQLHRLPIGQKPQGVCSVGAYLCFRNGEV
jgi:hypothetical protein